MTEHFSDYITLSRNGRVVCVNFDRGDGRNALSLQAMRELTDVARYLGEDTRSSVIVLRGQGAFSAGADLKDSEYQSLSAKTLLEQRQVLKLGPDMCQAWYDLEQITIASIEGFCVGGGLALALSCDHRVASPSAHFHLPEVALGMNMSWRSVPRIVSLVGPSKAKLLTVLCRKITGQTAFAWGLVDEVAAPGTVQAAALALAEDYAALPPLSLRMTKQAINESAMPLAMSTSFMDRDQFLLTAKSEDQAEAIAAFLEKRPADFSGT